MDRSTASHITLAMVFFWLPVVLFFALTGLFSAINYSFGLIFLILGILSTAGSVGILYRLRQTSRYWIMCLPLTAALITGTACAFLSMLIAPLQISPGDPAGSAIGTAGIVSLLCLAPGAFCLFIGILKESRNNSREMIAGGVSAVVSILSCAMLADMALAALKITGTAYFRHPFWEGFIMIYGLGNCVIGVMFILIAVSGPDDPALPATYKEIP